MRLRITTIIKHVNVALVSGNHTTQSQAHCRRLNKEKNNFNVRKCQPFQPIVPPNGRLMMLVQV